MMQDVPQDLSDRIKTALKYGPVKVVSKETQEETVHVPANWNGTLSGLPFGARKENGPYLLSFSIPKTTPITLAMAVEDEFALFETAKSIDLGLALAAQQDSVDSQTVRDLALRLNWFSAFLDLSVSQARQNISDPEADTGVSLSVGGQTSKESQDRAHKIIDTIDTILTRLNAALLYHNARHSPLSQQLN